MKGTIGFKNLAVSCVIGIYPEERKNRQNLLLDLTLTRDLTRCLNKGVTKEAFLDTFDYHQAAIDCQKIAETQDFFLIESYAEHLLNFFLEQTGVISVKIKVKKPQAIKKAEYAFVELEKANVG